MNLNVLLTLMIKHALVFNANLITKFLSEAFLVRRITFTFFSRCHCYFFSSRSQVPSYKHKLLSTFCVFKSAFLINIKATIPDFFLVIFTWVCIIIAISVYSYTNIMIKGFDLKLQDIILSK